MPLILLVLLSACATVPDGMRAVQSQDRVIYRLRSENIDPAAAYWGVNFSPRNYDLARAGFRYRTTARVTARTESQCEVTFRNVIKPVSRTSRTRTLTSSRTYIFGVDKARKRGDATVKFTPLYEVLQADAAYADAKVSPPDTLENAMEFLATSGTLTFQFDLESSRDAGSILGSFRKYCREQSHLHPVQVMNRTYSTSYLLASGANTIATFYVSLQRENNSTKASIIAIVKLAPDANYQVDAVAQAADMQHVISDIINN